MIEGFIAIKSNDVLNKMYKVLSQTVQNEDCMDIFVYLY